MNNADDLERRQFPDRAETIFSATSMSAGLQRLCAPYNVATADESDGFVT